MPRRFEEDKLVVASHNPGKIREIAELLSRFPVDLVSAAELNLPEPEETGTTFEDNALIKAHAAAKASGLPALSDDSGFCVEALNGEPGVHSARWAGPDKDFARAMRNVEERLQMAGALEEDRRRAGFMAVLALAWPDGHAETFDGRVDGIAVWPPRGDQGFGYDPIFKPDDHERTFGEMSADEKHGLDEYGDGLSHRARAFKKLVDACFDG